MLVVITIIDLVLRFRKARGVERQQFRMFVYAAAAFPVLLIVGLVISAFVDVPEVFDWSDAVVLSAWIISLNGMAAAIGVAITRHGLYQIDKVIARTVTYAVVTAALAMVYFGSVVVFSRLLASIGLSSQPGVALATLLAAAAFRPVRTRAQMAINRRFNRVRYNAQMVIEGLSDRLHQAMDLTELREQLLATVVATVQPAHAQLWLRERPAPLRSEQPLPGS